MRVDGVLPARKQNWKRYGFKKKIVDVCGSSGKCGIPGIKDKWGGGEWIIRAETGLTQ